LEILFVAGAVVEHLDKSMIRVAKLKGITGDRILSLE